MGGERQTAEFAQFVHARYPSLLRTGYLLVGDRGHAEDLVQSALVRTLGAWDRLTRTEAAEAYTRTTMVRLVARWRRRRWRGEIPSVTMPDTEPAPDADTALAMDVQRALARLPWEQRVVLVLRYFDDLTERETAAALGCSVGTVKSRASRALRTLRQDGLLAEEPEIRHG